MPLKQGEGRRRAQARRSQRQDDEDDEDEAPRGRRGRKRKKEEDSKDEDDRPRRKAPPRGGGRPLAGGGGGRGILFVTTFAGALVVKGTEGLAPGEDGPLGKLFGLGLCFVVSVVLMPLGVFGVDEQRTGRWGLEVTGNMGVTLGMVQVRGRRPAGRIRPLRSAFYIDSWPVTGF